MSASQAVLDMQVSGMSCGNCVRHVAEALRGVDGVRDAQVDLQAASAQVVYDPESVTVDRLIGAVEEAGYQASVASAGQA